MDQKSIVIDVRKCMGCRGCQVACKIWNRLPVVATTNTGSYENPPSLRPDNYTRVVFIEEVIDGKLKWLFRKEQCLHCTKAPCVEMCPVDAIGYDEFGFTEIDLAKCIGCGICVAICPYEVPYLDSNTKELKADWEKQFSTSASKINYVDTGKKARKCWFCLDRVSNGMSPACAKACPTDAIKFGNRTDILKYARDIRDNSNGKVYLYGETQYMGLHMLYLLPEKPDVFGLSDEGKILSKLDKTEVYALLEKNLAGSPVKDEVLVIAALKYFGDVHI